MKIGKVAIDRSIEVDPTQFHELHDGGIRKELGNRPYTINGVRSGGNFLLRVRQAETLSPDNLLIIHQRDRNGRQGLIFHLLRNRLRQRRSDVNIRGSDLNIDLCAQGGAEQTAKRWNEKAYSQ